MNSFFFGRQDLWLTTVSLLFSFSTLFLRHNSRHYVIFQLQINYLTELPFVLSPSDPCNFERLSKIHSCMFFHTITVLIIYMKKILNSDWQRAMQFFSKYNAKKRNTGQKNKYSANKIIFLTFLIFNFSNFLIFSIS